MDLSQAEAVADLITLQSAATHRMRGDFSRRLSPLREKPLRWANVCSTEKKIKPNGWFLA